MATKRTTGRPRGRPPVGEQAMTDMERHKRYMARLRARAEGMDEDGELHGIPADQVERIIDYVAQARDGLITARQLVTRIGRVIGVKLEP